MNSTPSPLDQPASIPVLRRLLNAGALTLPELKTMEAQVRRELPWKARLDRGLLCLGVTLIPAGIGYFFAHNWDHLTNNDKLGLASGAVLLSLIGATWAGLDCFGGKLLLLAASALVGVFLAVFGQVYQTGADSYELFTGWAFLIFPWVALGRFMPLWIFWISLLNLALGFYGPVSPFFGLDDWALFRHEALSLVLLNGGVLLLREIASRRPPAWFDRTWSTLILLTATTVAASVEVSGEILHTWDSTMPLGGAFLAGGLDAAFVTGLGFYFSRIRYSLPALAIITLNACTVLTILTIRALNFDRVMDPSIWLFAGIITLAIFGDGVFFLRSQRLSHQPDSSP
jgi:uncharacterized membrane protein